MTLYRSDAAIAEELGIGRDKFAALAKVWERAGFPPRDPQIGKRYWPACRAWLDRRNGLLPQSAKAGAFMPDGEENWDVN